MNDENFKRALEKTLRAEGGFTENYGRLDQPTNMGIKKDTLDLYNQAHPKFNFPKNVQDLTLGQVEQIYKMDYWDAGRLDMIENPRIRDALFDTSVMSGYGKMASQLQEALNKFNNSNTGIDGIMGSRTLKALNDITGSAVNDFMDTFKEIRMNHLQYDSPRRWNENKNGWTSRTMRY